jgi:antagonist of KipI
MAFSIIKSGILDSIQDLGRHGYGNWGINPGGAMDRYAIQVANMLVGNCPTESALELHFPGPQILFEHNMLIAITGADFTPMINDEPVPLWQPVVVRKNTVLHFPRLRWGARSYLSIHGGLVAHRWLNSCSTHLKAGVGGLSGRPLQKGDELAAKESSVYFAAWLQEDKNIRILPWKVAPERIYGLPHEIMVVRGKEWERLHPGSVDSFHQDNFIIHPFSDRMGYQLKGTPLQIHTERELISSAVSFGTLQLLPCGQLVVLMADHQTTGGYPRIAHVVSAHLPKLAQLRPSETLQFKTTDVGTAEGWALDMHREMAILRRSCADHLSAMAC